MRHLRGFTVIDLRESIRDLRALLTPEFREGNVSAYAFAAPE
jgi:hypothetical protein